MKNIRKSTCRRAMMKMETNEASIDNLKSLLLCGDRSRLAEDFQQREQIPSLPPPPPPVEPEFYFLLLFYRSCR